ncbi:MAG: sugar isomerase [Anaerostipes sp.]|nr:sugar isomerase [Anaerostipes sp.]
MEDYIKETSSVMVRNIGQRKELTEPLISWLETEGIRQGKTLVIVASGSSYNAVYSALEFMESNMKNPVRLITPFAFTYYEELKQNNIYLFVSQSGSSTNVVEAVKMYQKTGRHAMAVLGKPKSAIAELSDFFVEYGAGEERVGYVTKGMSTLTCYFMLLSLELSSEGRDGEMYQQSVRKLKSACEKHHHIYLQAKEFCLKNKEALLSMKHAFFISSGANMGTVKEGSLKLSEMVHIPTAFFEAEEFIHGPDLQLTPDYTLFFVSAGDGAGKRTEEICCAAGEVTPNSFLLKADFEKANREDEMISPLYLTAFFQYLACWTAENRGITTEHPLYMKFEEKIHCKTSDYEEDVPF